MVNNDSCCFAKILKAIEVLQNNSDNSICCDDGCDRGFLGPVSSLICYNTRPVQFYTRNGELFEASYTSGETTITTNTFRVEKINDCCCKCRLLNVDTSGNITSTNYFVTINLKCMCVLKCLSDIALEYA